MHKILTGNHAVSYAVKLARVNVIAAYPITPQTSVVEELSEMCARGELKAEFIHSEMEHSAMSACIGAAMTGARAFTATSSQGLAHMCEMLHWAAGGRVPVVMAEVNRSLAPPWTIFTDQQDSLSQRDTGWMQFYCRDNQEVLDTTLLAFKVAEQVNLPAMVVLDAFVLSHTAEPVDIPSQELVDAFLPPRKAVLKLDTKQPRAFGGMMNTDIWMESRVKLHHEMNGAIKVIEDAAEEWRKLTGRHLKPLQSYLIDDAETVLLAAGTAAWTASLAVDQLRAQGLPVGALGLWTFRPFPVEALRKTLSKASRLIVLDRSCSYGHSGIFAQECRSALYDLPQRPQIIGVIGGLGGREIKLTDIIKTTRAALENPPKELVTWMAIKE